MKKVRKFLDCAVDITVDKKQLKLDMDRAFQSIKDCYAEKVGHDRSVKCLLTYYVMRVVNMGLLIMYTVVYRTQSAIHCISTSHSGEQPKFSLIFINKNEPFDHFRPKTVIHFRIYFPLLFQKVCFR